MLDKLNQLSESHGELKAGRGSASGAVSLFNIVFGRVRWLSMATFVLIGLVLALGGHRVEVDPNFPDGTPYIGLDWFILDLLGSTLVFIFVEKLFPLRKEQPVFRYGVVGDYVPNGFWKQLKFPFVWKV